MILSILLVLIAINSGVCGWLFLRAAIGTKSERERLAFASIAVLLFLVFSTACLHGDFK